MRKKILLSFLMLSTVEYVIIICILLNHNKCDTFSALLKHIYSLDSEMNVDFFLTDLKIIVCLVLYAFYECVIDIAICYFTEFCTCQDELLSCFYENTVTVSVFVYIFLLQLVYIRLKKLKIIIEHSVCTRRGILLYKHLIDALDKSKPIFQRLVSIIHASGHYF